MSDTPSKRDQQREERRKQILDAALTVFSQKGYHATNVSDVAAQAGVSQGTIYWYFESKEALFNSAMLAVFAEFSSDSFAALEECETASGKLRCLAQSMQFFAEEAEGLFTLFVGYWASSSRPEQTSQLWVNLLAEFKDVISEILDEGVRRGEFKPVDADALVWALLAAYDGLAAYLTLIPELDLQRVSEVFVETLLTGLATERSEGQVVGSSGQGRATAPEERRQK
jgi:AcrR family transcriptional regulator